MDQRTIMLGAFVFGAAFIVMVVFAPQLLENKPSAEVVPQKEVAQVEAAPEPEVDENDSSNDGPAEEMSIDQQEAEANPFGED